MTLSFDFSFDDVGLSFEGLDGYFGSFSGTVCVSLHEFDNGQSPSFEHWRITAQAKGCADLVYMPPLWDEAIGNMTPNIEKPEQRLAVMYITTLLRPQRSLRACSLSVPFGS